VFDLTSSMVFFMLEKNISASNERFLVGSSGWERKRSRCKYEGGHAAGFVAGFAAAQPRRLPAGNCRLSRHPLQRPASSTETRPGRSYKADGLQMSRMRQAAKFRGETCVCEANSFAWENTSRKLVDGQFKDERGLF
jgi:hypothetical protein